MWKAIGVGFAVIALTALLVLSTWTLLSIRTGISNHSGTLNAIHGDVVQIKKLSKEVHAYQQASAQGKTEVDKLLVEAGAVSKKLQADMLAICAETHTSCP